MEAGRDFSVAPVIINNNESYNNMLKALFVNNLLKSHTPYMQL